MEPQLSVLMLLFMKAVQIVFGLQPTSAQVDLSLQLATDYLPDKLVKYIVQSRCCTRSPSSMVHWAIV